MAGIAIILAAAVSAAQATAEIPKSITVNCGDLLVRFEGKKFWTMNRIEHKGTLLCVDTDGSHYGSVVKFPGIGYVGTGHRENEDEKVLALRFFIDGNPVQPQTLSKDTRAKTFRLERDTTIRDLSFSNVIELRDNRIYETVTLKSVKEQPLELMYNFMHPWITDNQYFLAGTDDGKEMRGTFSDSHEYKVDAPMDWSSVYDPASGKGIVTRLLAKPEIGGADMQLWDVKDRYRKFYLRSFNGETVPAGFKGEYRIVTGFFEAKDENWEQTARNLAESLRENRKAE